MLSPGIMQLRPRSMRGENRLLFFVCTFGVTHKELSGTTLRHFFRLGPTIKYLSLRDNSIKTCSSSAPPFLLWFFFFPHLPRVMSSAFISPLAFQRRHQRIKVANMFFSPSLTQKRGCLNLGLHRGVMYLGREQANKRSIALRKRRRRRRPLIVASSTSKVIRQKK